MTSRKRGPGDDPELASRQLDELTVVVGIASAQATKAFSESTNVWEAWAGLAPRMDELRTGVIDALSAGEDGTTVVRLWLRTEANVINLASAKMDASQRKELQTLLNDKHGSLLQALADRDIALSDIKLPKAKKELDTHSFVTIAPPTPASSLSSTAPSSATIQPPDTDVSMTSGGGGGVTSEIAQGQVEFD